MFESLLTATEHAAILSDLAARTRNSLKARDLNVLPCKALSKDAVRSR